MSLRKLNPFKKSEKTARHKRTRRAALGVQKLDERKLMAADFGFGGGSGVGLTPDVGLENQVLQIEGSFLADEVEVKLANIDDADPLNDLIVVTTKNFLSNQTTEIPMYMPDGYRNVRQIEFNGHGGDDKFVNQTNIRSTARGGQGDDRFEGGTAADWFYGGSGDDVLKGLEGEDRLFGGSGDDFLAGGVGNDRVYGSSGDDEMYGGDDDDKMYGGSGVDVVYGELGNDYMRGGSGDDRMYGGKGNDSVLGDRGHDEIHGDAGNDLLDGGEGDDDVYGNDDADLVFGGNGSDHVYGGAGNDVVSGGRVNFQENGRSSLGDQADWDIDGVYGGEGSDYLIQSDHYVPFLFSWDASWMDYTGDLDESEGDQLIRYGWIFNTGIAIDFDQFGHQYNGPTH